MIVITTHLTRSSKVKEIFTDSWTKYDNYEEAKAAYEQELEHPQLFTASIVKVVESTDYEPDEVNPNEPFEIDKVIDELIRRMEILKTSLQPETLGICGIVEFLKVTCKINKKTYDIIKAEVELLTKVNTKFWNFQGERVDDATKFVFPPYKFKPRLQFLKMIKERYAE